MGAVTARLTWLPDCALVEMREYITLLFVCFIESVKSRISIFYCTNFPVTVCFQLNRVRLVAARLMILDAKIAAMIVFLGVSCDFFFLKIQYFFSTWLLPSHFLSANLKCYRKLRHFVKCIVAFF